MGSHLPKLLSSAENGGRQEQEQISAASGPTVDTTNGITHPTKLVLGEQPDQFVTPPRLMHVADFVDPRSPTVGVARTPVIAEWDINGNNSLLSKAQGDTGHTSTHDQSSFLDRLEEIPYVDDELEAAGSSGRENLKNNSFSGFTHTTADDLLLVNEGGKRKTGASLRSRIRGLRKSIRRISLHNALQRSRPVTSPQPASSQASDDAGSLSPETKECLSSVDGQLLGDHSLVTTDSMVVMNGSAIAMDSREFCSTPRLGRSNDGLEVSILSAGSKSEKLTDFTDVSLVSPFEDGRDKL